DRSGQGCHQTLHPGTQCGVRCRKAEPQKAFPPRSKGAAGGEPDVGGIDQALGAGLTIRLAFYLEKQIECALWPCQADTGQYRQTLIDEITSLPTLLYQAFEVRIAVGQGFEAAVLQELRDTRSTVLHQIFVNLP